jgi:FkbH-like protein
MAPAPTLSWLPADADWRSRLRRWRSEGAGNWETAAALASVRLDFVQTNALDDAVRSVFGAGAPDGLGTKPLRLAILGSATQAHLHASIRVAALRRRIWVTTYENDYGQYWQELSDTSSRLYAFEPNVVLFAIDSFRLTQGAHAGLSPQDAGVVLEETTSHLRQCWRTARAAFQCPILQQTLLPVHSSLLGSNEHRLPGSRSAFVSHLNARLRTLADEDGIDLVAVDTRVSQEGLNAWHDPALWNRSKQEVSPAAAPVYGELVARLLAAHQGKSAKCLALDLDNTLWGGVIGDDGLEGVALGQGSPEGEAFVRVQTYAKELARRGVILAICSKNDEARALEPFERHPEMVLRREDIGSFMANWSDKPTNLRAIAAELNIGLDTIVFLDDNPMERDLVRRELPMVAVPEIPEDPALVPQCLADAGYFEATVVTEEDRKRTAQYQSKLSREAFKAESTDLTAYLRGLGMRLLWRPFDRLGLQRIVQLINKTNQFNLTTRRYSEDDVLRVMQDTRAFGLQLRLVDRFGDNGVIAIVIGKLLDDFDLLIDTWLMSCRVLGRQVEQATLALLVQQARGLGAQRLIGEYRPTAKNGMVREHYRKLGFSTLIEPRDGGGRNALELSQYTPAEIFIEIVRG